MATVWYVEYADEFGTIDPTTVYNDVLATIKTEDPTAYIQEVRQYPYQLAFKVVHPEPQTLARRTGLPIPVVIVAIAYAIALALAAYGFVVIAHAIYNLTTRKYVDKDPVTGEPVEFPTYNAYRDWLIIHYPQSADYLDHIGAKAWWEPIVKPIVKAVVVIIGLFGLSYILPSLMGAFKKKRRGD